LLGEFMAIATGYTIQKAGATPTRYWRGRHKDDWTYEATEAVLFERAADAQVVGDLIFGKDKYNHTRDAYEYEVA